MGVEDGVQGASDGTAVDTIHAPATAPGKAGVAIIRVSGPNADAITAAIAGTPLPAPRRAALRDLRMSDGALIDRGLVLRFDAGGSFTGEAVAEFHVHGGPAIVAAALDAVRATGQSRLARPGEFTRRAFASGSLDLQGVHAIADAIDAETELQRRFAMARLAGGERGKAERWRKALIHVAARLEASIDFADEDLPDDMLSGLAGQLDDLVRDMQADLTGFAAARALREGFEVALVGVPNAGKSSLLNAIARREAAIVSDVAGTTRDVVEVRMDLDGVPVILMDMAGIRDGADAVERIGVERARQRAEAADLRIFLLSGPDHPPGVTYRDGDVVVRGKADLQHGGDVSSLTGEGIDALLGSIREALLARTGQMGGVTRDYEADAIRAAIDHVRGASECLRHDGGVEIVLDTLYGAISDIGLVTGQIAVEDLLDDIFGSFCLGK